MCRRSKHKRGVPLEVCVPLGAARALSEVVGPSEPSHHFACRTIRFWGRTHPDCCNRSPSSGDRGR